VRVHQQQPPPILGRATRIHACEPTGRPRIRRNWQDAEA
jgi:hypothetical protein